MGALFLPGIDAVPIGDGTIAVPDFDIMAAEVDAAAAHGLVLGAVGGHGHHLTVIIVAIRL